MRHFKPYMGTLDSEGQELPVNTASFGEETQNVTANADIVNTAGTIAKTSVDNTLSKVSELMSSSEVQNTLKSMGLDVVVKNTSREAVKNVLSLLGIWYASSLVRTAFKSKYALLAVAGVVGAIYFKGSESNEIMKELNKKVG